MHEVGIIESALALVQRHAAQHGASRVVRVGLRVGALSGTDVDALRFAFDVVTRGTIADGAALDIERVPVAVYCAACRAEFAAPGSYVFACPTCGDFSGEVRAGRELELARIEFETEPAAGGAEPRAVATQEA